MLLLERDLAELKIGRFDQLHLHLHRLTFSAATTRRIALLPATPIELRCHHPLATAAIVCAADSGRLSWR